MSGTRRTARDEFFGVVEAAAATYAHTMTTRATDGYPALTEREKQTLRRENLPAPPYGYEVVKFRTTFANRADVVETVTLEEQAGGWGVVGIVLG